MDIVNADSTSSTELVLDLVMSYLPLKDCVRTSILSSRWRYRWTTVPSLVFDETCCPRSFRFSMEEKGKALVSIINRVLSLHNGSIQVFEVRGPCVAPDIGCWISRVFSDSIKTLVLDLWHVNFKQYTLFSALFKCGSLSSLKLINCLLRPSPSCFKGFKNLNCLELEHVTLTNDALEKLISPFPLLEKLTLSEIKEVDSLNINAPNLQNVSIDGEFVNITFGYAMTKLSVIHVNALECSYPSLVDLFIKLPNTRRLELENCCLGFMSGDSIQEGFPFQCKDLCRLAIRMGFDFPLDSPLILCLCRDLPGMEGWWDSSLAIEVGAWKDNSRCDYKFKNLRSVTMDDFLGRSEELKFAEFVLENSPVLEEVIVNPSDEITWKDLKKVFKFRRPPGAKIILDRCVD